MTALEQLQQQTAVDLPGDLPVDLPGDEAIGLAQVADIVERLRAGQIFVELREDRIEHRAASLAAILEQIAGDNVNLVWTGNPLRSPLTIERLIIQAAGPDADLRVERSPEELAHMLMMSAETESVRLVIVQQPETLDPAARDTLARMEPHLAHAPPRIQILFCGTQAFRPIQQQPEPAVGSAHQLAIVPANLALGEEAERGFSRREAVPLLLLLAATTVGAVWPGTTKSVADQPPAEPVRIVAPQATQTEDVTTVDVAAMRREFDHFLAQQPDRVSALTPEQRSVLFDEYLERARKSLSARHL